MAYQQMAHFYDRLMAHAPYDDWLAFTLEAFRESCKKVETIADLGCGTGEITVMLAKAGFSATGVDYAEDMLAVAAHKAEQVAIQWVCQDWRKLHGLPQMDAAVSYCDVVNYLTTEEELYQAFQHTADLLKPGGLFIFDVHSLSHVYNNLQDETFADVNDDASYIWFCSAGEEPGELHHELTFFARNGDKYERFDEYHHQRTYPIEFFLQLLTETGFENVKVCADFSLKNEISAEEAERIFFIAEKRSG